MALPWWRGAIPQQQAEVCLITMEGSRLDKLVGFSHSGQLGHRAKPCMNTQALCPMLLLTAAQDATREQSGPLKAIRLQVWSNLREQCLVWFIMEADTGERAAFSLLLFPGGKGNGLCLCRSIDMPFTNQTGARLCKTPLSRRPFQFPLRD